MKLVLIGTVSLAAALSSLPVLTTTSQASPPIILAAAPQAGEAKAPHQEGPQQDKQLTPEEKMARRFPQPVQVGFLIGLPVLDWSDSTVGYIRDVVRTPEGKVQLIVPYNRWFGWIKNGTFFDRYRRPVAVPIETVAILAQQVDVLDMPIEEFETAPEFVPSKATPVPPTEHIRIAITRR